ncbi:MAG: hypothetical protein ACI4CX_01785 [Candidatus Weimeria sp.]
MSRKVTILDDIFSSTNLLEKINDCHRKICDSHYLFIEKPS